MDTGVMSQKIIHHEIAKVAKAFAAEAYELALQAGAIDKRQEKARNAYIAQHFGDYIWAARQALLAILRKDYTFEISMGQHTAKTVEEMKERIYQALLIDGSFKAPAPLQANSDTANRIPV